MRKNYPYLSEDWIDDENGQRVRRNFLAKIDDFINQKQYIKITLLNWEEEPLKEIQGELTSGSLTKDGSSAVRRTCQFSATLNCGEYNIRDANMDFSINKKIYLEIGVENMTNQYKEYPILWFPQGVFFISSFSISAQASSNLAVNLTCKDKMCGLNGDVGGALPATVVFDEMDTQTPSGEFAHKKVLIADLIQELVHHYGGEPINNIIIEDIPQRIKRIVKWTGDTPLYMRPISDSDGYTYYETTIQKPDKLVYDTGTEQISWQQYNNGMDVGYVYSDFVYDSELIGNIGESVVTILDRIKQYLGNFEYFYDEFGVFHFREIKNYLNKSQSSTILDDMKKKDYLVNIVDGKTVYSFNDKTNLISISNNPKYENIKNDYIIQGLRKGTKDSQGIMVRYHLAVDTKPTPGNEYHDILLYQEANTNLKKLVFPVYYDKYDKLPEVGNFNIIYRVPANTVPDKPKDDKPQITAVNSDDNRFAFFYWEDNAYKEVKKITYYAEDRSGYITKDWRTELYILGLLKKNTGTDKGKYYQSLEQNHNLLDKTWIGRVYQQSAIRKLDIDYYFEELDAFWPQIYDLEEQRFNGQVVDETLKAVSLADGNYYLDFIEPNTSEFGQYSIANIGRRTDAVNDDDINCIFQPDIPDIIFLNADSDDITEKREECNRTGQTYTQVRGDIFNALFTGGYKNAAFDRVKYELYLHTNYQETLSISALPVFYLEPNSRVSINDTTTNINGDYNIQSINLPLGAGQPMTITANAAIERF